jgi:hypothetical protein
MLNQLPFIGWILDFIFKVSLALPFWICWTVGGIGQKYFYFLPLVYQKIGFWHCVGIFIVLSILGGFIKQLSPFSFNQTINKSQDKD